MTTGKVTSQALQLTLVYYIFKLVLYFNSIIVSNQVKYYLATNSGNFLQIELQLHIYRQIHLQAFTADTVKGMLCKLTIS